MPNPRPPNRHPSEGWGPPTAAPPIGSARMPGLIASAALTLLAATPTTAQNGLDNLASVATLEGTCEQLVVAGRDVAAECAGHLINSAHTDGRSGFSFFAAGRVVDFVGADSAYVGNSATLHVDTILIAHAQGPTPPRPENMPARGTCTYTNPYAGVATILCAADTAQGPFRVRFRSNGNPPGGGRVK